MAEACSRAVLRFKAELRCPLLKEVPRQSRYVNELSPRFVSGMREVSCK
jgi:hypothetical protein